MQISEERESFLPTQRNNKCDQTGPKFCKSFFFTKYYDRPEKSAGLLTKLRYAILCPPHGKLSRIITFILCMFLVWLTALSVSPRDALPGTSVFSLIILFTVGILAGKLTTLLKLPDILGMFLVGVLFRNVPRLDIAQHILPFWSLILQNFSLTVLLLQAGMSLSSIPFSFSSILYRLHLIPFVSEFTACSLIYRFVLDLPWSWSFSLGSLLSCMSTSVVVSQLLDLKKLDYGVDHKIPSQLIVVCVINNAFAILTSHLVWTKESFVKALIQKIVDPFLEVFSGFLFGVMLWYFPPPEARFKFFLRAMLMLFGSFLFLVGPSVIGLSANGHLCLLTIGYIASLRWKKHREHRGQNLNEEMLKLVSDLWLALRPLYFGLLGCEMNMSSIDLRVMGLVGATLFIGILCRIVSTLFLTLSSSLSIKERFFLTLAFIPKADIQVALSAFILQKATEEEGDKTLSQYSYIVLNMTVLASFFTLPLGAVFIERAGRLLLQQRVAFRRSSTARNPFLSEELPLEEPVFEEITDTTSL